MPDIADALDLQRYDELRRDAEMSEEGAAHRTGMIAGVGLVRASWRRPTHERIERLRV